MIYSVQKLTDETHQTIGSVMPPKKPKVQSKQDDNDVEVRVEQSSMAGVRDNTQELSDLIRSIIREEISVVITKLTTITDDISACTRRLDEVDETLSGMDSRITKLETECVALRKTNVELTEKAERLEKHSRKNNVRVFGLPDNIENGHPTNYMNMLFKELFKDKLKSEPEVDIAHRIGPVRKEGGKAMIVRLQQFAVKEEIMKVVKNERMMQIRGMKLKIFPDLTKETAKKRASFWELRAKLKSADVRHGIIHPATLILTFKGETKKFTERSEAEAYYETVIKPGLKNKGEIQ